MKKIINNQDPTQYAHSKNEKAYDTKASLYCEKFILIWCIVGLIYAGVSWRIFWLPGILIIFPGIFVASLVAAIFFIPYWLLRLKDYNDWTEKGRKRNVLFAIALILRSLGFFASIAAPIYYVKILRNFMN